MTNLDMSKSYTLNNCVYKYAFTDNEIIYGYYFINSVWAPTKHYLDGSAVPPKYNSLVLVLPIIKDNKIYTSNQYTNITAYVHHVSDDDVFYVVFDNGKRKYSDGCPIANFLEAYETT